MEEQIEKKEKNTNSTISVILELWMLISIAMMVLGFFKSMTPWINLFFWFSAMFGGAGIIGFFSSKKDEKENAKYAFMLGVILCFITALINGIWWVVFSSIPVFLIAVGMCKTNAKPESANEPISDELPEENLPEVDPATIFSDEGISISAAITYFAQIKKKYAISTEIWTPIRGQLIRIRQHVNDKTLYLGVVGEASAGKSTFINALLGFEFLKEDTSLGTTVASTILRYGEKVGIIINYLEEGKKEYIDAKTLGVSKKEKIENWAPKVLDTIHKYTVDEEIASTIYSVEVTLPIENDLLKSGVAIVDTPGINSGNERHNEVTTRTIREICDTALILVPANVPLSACLSRYIKDNLLDILGRCVLLMTQADKLRRAKERTMQLKYIASRLKSATGGEVAASFSASAYYVLNRDDYGKADEEMVKQYRDEFAQMADSLKKIIIECRHSAILEKILLFMNSSLLPLLSDLIGKKKDEYNQRKQALEENALTDIDNFIQDEIELYQEDISDVTIAQSEIVSELTKVRQTFLDNMHRRIFSADDRDELKSAMTENVIKGEISGLQAPLKRALNSLAAPYREALSAAMENVHNDFSVEYQKLEQISKQESSSSFAKIDDGAMNVSVSVVDFGDKIDTQLGADVMKSVGGAGAGAVIGSFICPGLGTLIGGVLGGIFGALFGKSLDELKKDAYASICNVGNDWLSQMVTQANQYMDSYQKSAAQMLNEGIEAYKTKYGEKISSMIQAEKDEQEDLQEMAQTAENDLSLFKKMHPEIESMIQSSRVSSRQDDQGNTTEQKN